MHFLIYREGRSNTHNSLGIVGIFEGEDGDAAKAEAESRGVTVYNGQYLRAVPEAEADSGDWNEAGSMPDPEIYPGLTAEEAIRQAKL